MPGNENGEGVFAERKRSASQVKWMTQEEAQSRSHRTWFWQASKRAKNMSKEHEICISHQLLLELSENSFPHMSGSNAGCLRGCFM